MKTKDISYHMEDHQFKSKIMMHPLNEIIQPDRNNEEANI